MTFQPPCKRAVRLLGVAFALALVGAACSSSATNESLERIVTNDGAITIGAPDDGVDEAADAVSGVEAPPAADAVAFTWFDGQTGSTADFAGQPTVVNFWASNCAACVAEMPEFEAEFKALGGEVNFVGVNVADIRSEAEVLVAQTGVTYPLVSDPESSVFRSYGGFVMPTTVFLNEAGEPVYAWSGVLTGSELRILIDHHIAPGTL